ncbi:MAG TPA: sulfite exporter TauE/SafE family protein [Candidatus Paceibacterota bacterium]|nr:sulfite exporter TauE/SafE family protein [Candidatus Paceibacterota bacterium]
MEIILIALLTFVASTVGTLAGFGISTIMVPTLLFFFPFSVVLIVVGIIHWFGNLWRIIIFRKGFRLRLTLLFGIPGMAAAVVGAFFVSRVSDTLLSQILGGILLFYVLFLLMKPTFTLSKKPISSIAAGTLSGFFSGIFGIGGVLRSMFLSAYNLPKSVFIATAGAVSVLVDSSRLPVYFLNGNTVPEELFFGLLLFIFASFLGVEAAKFFVHKIPEKRFRAVILCFLFFAGIKLLFFS